MSKEKDLAFDTEIGQKAIVEHHAIENDEYTGGLREVLADMAADLQAVGKVPKGLTYEGSFSVHVYSSSIAGTFAFAGVSNPGSCSFKLAEAAGKKLAQDINEHYRGSRQKLRSGF